MLKTRVKTGAVLTAIGLLLLYFSYLPYVMCTFAALLSVIGTYELFRAAKCLNKRALWTAIAAAAVIPFVMPHIPGSRIVISALFLTAITMFFCFLPRVGKSTFAGTGKACAASLAVSVLYSSIPILRSVEYGIYYICLAVLTSVITDVAAYFIGKAVGRHKIAPKVSPGKTIEGCIGGVLVACAIGMLSVFIIHKQTGILVRCPLFLGYFVLASVIGQIGDLSMSLIKRDAGIKDFGKLLPGHGGVLDRFDSQLFVIPFTVAFSDFCSAGILDVVGLFP